MRTTLAVYFKAGLMSELQGITTLTVATTLPAAAVTSRAPGKEKGNESLYFWSKTIWRLISE